MSITIKFRAWHKLEQRMYEWGSGVIAIDHQLNVSTVPAGRTLKHEDIELMQSTGLLDCKGQEIYEGDIVHSDYWNCDWEVRWCNGKREFLRGQVGWILDDEKLCSVGHVEELTAHCEISEPPGREDYFNGYVIGNIYETPNLPK